MINIQYISNKVFVVKCVIVSVLLAYIALYKLLLLNCWLKINYKYNKNNYWLQQLIIIVSALVKL